MSGTPAEQIEIIQLHQRTAEEVIPIIRPLMQPGEALSGTGFKLILRASSGTVDEVRRIVSQIDTGLKNLVVSVNYDDEAQAGRRQAGAEIRYSSEKGGIVAGHVRKDQVLDRSQVSQRVRVIEGGAAYIHTGKTLFAPGVGYSTGEAITPGSIQQDFGTGFYVIPRVNGSQVNLEISPYRETASMQGNTLDVQSANTVVSGQLGEWIYIGGVSQSERLGQSGILNRQRSVSERESGIFVKVDIVE